VWESMQVTGILFADKNLRVAIITRRIISANRSNEIILVYYFAHYRDTYVHTIYY